MNYHLLPWRDRNGKVRSVSGQGMGRHGIQRYGINLGMIRKVCFRFLIATLVVLLSFTHVYSDTGAVISDNTVIIQFDGPLKNAAREVIELYPRVKKEIEGILGWEIDFKPSILLIKENSKFQEVVENPHIIAFADPHRNLIAIDYSRMNVSPFTLEVTVKHELCHLLLGKHIPDDRLPRWLNEGFCQWVTGGIGEFMVDDRQPNLRKASLSGQLIPLWLLSGRFPSQRDQMALAYEESRSVVEYMIAEHGQSGVVNIMNNMKHGDTVDEAIKKVLFVSIGELERQWILYLRERVTWAGYLAANIYLIILFAAALLTICGFLRIVMRRRLRAAQVEEDNEDEVTGG